MRDGMEGRMKSKRPRGRRRKGILDELLDRQSYQAEDRMEWRGCVETYLVVIS